MFLQRSHLSDNRWQRVASWLMVLSVVLSSIGVMLPVATQAQSVVAAPTFSSARGFYSSPVQLTLSSQTVSAAIRYTLDGSTPTPTTGTLTAAQLPSAKQVRCR